MNEVVLKIKIILYGIERIRIYPKYTATNIRMIFLGIYLRASWAALAQHLSHHTLPPFLLLVCLSVWVFC
jgi:hypothetical protein